MYDRVNIAEYSRFFRNRLTINDYIVGAFVQQYLSIVYLSYDHITEKASLSLQSKNLVIIQDFGRTDKIGLSYFNYTRCSRISSSDLGPK